jgi:hypothetical protein
MESCNKKAAKEEAIRKEKEAKEEAKRKEKEAKEEAKRKEKEEKEAIKQKLEEDKRMAKMAEYETKLKLKMETDDAKREKIALEKQKAIDEKNAIKERKEQEKEARRLEQERIQKLENRPVHFSMMNLEHIEHLLSKSSILFDILSTGDKATATFIKLFMKDPKLRNIRMNDNKIETYEPFELKMSHPKKKDYETPEMFEKAKAEFYAYVDTIDEDDGEWRENNISKIHTDIYELLDRYALKKTSPGLGFQVNWVLGQMYKTMWGEFDLQSQAAISQMTDKYRLCDEEPDIKFDDISVKILIPKDEE